MERFRHFSASILSTACFCFLACMAKADTVAVPESIAIPATANSPEIPGYLGRPIGSGPFPAVLVLHGCEGFGSLQNSTVDDLARAGYVTLAIDTLKPQGVKNACSNVAGAVRSGVGYAVAALSWLRSQPYVDATRLGVLGFSMGGIEALSLIDPFTPQPPVPGLRAAVAYYPNCVGRSSNISTPLLILNGGEDDWVPPAGCQAIVQGARAAKNPVQMITYQGATHDFNEPSAKTRIYNGHKLTYDPQSASDADARTKAFFGEYLH